MRLAGLKSILIAVLLPLGLLTARTAIGQGTGEFLCSGGARDGLSCESFDDCPNGVCVIAQGICSDGFICDCPSGTCTNDTRCSDDQTFGTCAGGVSPGLCCDVALNCADGDSCVGTQKVCLNGQDQGFSCTNDSQCRNGTCGSTACYCDGGDYDAFTCVSTSDCPGGGTCTCFSAATPTVPVRTATPTRTTQSGTPLPTDTPRPTSTAPNTRTPFQTSTPGPSNTPGPVQTNTPVFTITPLPTFTPSYGVLATTVTEAFAGGNKLVVDGDPRLMPVEGVVEVLGYTVPFTRRRSSQILDLQAQYGLPIGVPAGTLIRLVASTPTPGPGTVEYRGEGEGCQLSTGSTSGSWLMLLGGVLLLRRRRPS